MGAELEGWEVFSKCELLPRSKRTQAIYDFYSRWLFANRFVGVEVEPPYAERSRVPYAYWGLARLMFAYSARQQLVRGLAPKGKRDDVGFWPVCNSDLARRFHEALYRGGVNQMIADSLEKGDVHGSARGRLIDFRDRKDDDILPVLICLRHAAAHGSITPTGAGLTRDEMLIDLIREGTDALLADSAVRFSEWVRGGGVDKLARRP